MSSTHELSKLWQLQQIDLKLDRLQDHLNQPHHLAALQSAEAPARTALRQLKQQEQRLNELRKEIRRGEWEIDNLQSQIKEAEATLYGGRGVNAKEVLAVERKLNLIKEQYNQSEETMLESMLQYEALQADTAQLKKDAKIAVDIYHDLKRKLEAEVAAAQAEIAALRQQRQTLSNQIQPDWLTRYAKVRERYSDAIAQIEDTVCGACRVHIPGVLKAQAKAGERTYCETCGRLLYAAE
ncbi:MAG TPA: hypothetical protein GXZ82_15575 [Firmicutes bacterium]|jgi:predicted  nucleic acid-binding Zn-ribbon protein|nr:hypothetical protein [Bacillota bacterium]